MEETMDNNMDNKMDKLRMTLGECRDLALEVLARHGGGWVAYGEKGDVIKSMPGYKNTEGHIDNFLECVRTGARPNADVEIAHESHILAHTSNIAYRVGKRRLRWDGTPGRVGHEEEA